MKPYQPSNKVTSTGLKWLLLSSAIGGVAIGGLTHLISLLVYAIVLFPLGMGLAGGAVMAGAIRQGKVRNPAMTVFRAPKAVTAPELARAAPSAVRAAAITIWRK